MQLKESLAMVMIGLIMGSLLTLTILNLQQAQETHETVEEFAEGKNEVEEPVVIAEIGFVDIETRKILTWKEVKEKLNTLKNIGVNTIFLWAPYDHPKKPINTIPCWTEVDGEVKKIDLPIAKFNVINLHAKDYLKPDSRRGSEEEFLEFIDEAHKLGFKVIGQFIATCVSPESFFCREHPEWLLKTEIEGEEYPAVSWPWRLRPWGYVVNKAHPGFINYTCEVVIPYWIKEWGLDGIFLDSPAMPYCSERFQKLCGAFPSGFECLTPVKGNYTPDNLIKAMRRKIEELERETGRDLIFAAEWIPTGRVEYWPDEAIKDFCEKWDLKAFWRYNRQYARYELGSYFDFIWDYRFRGLLKQVKLLTSDRYVEFLNRQMEKEAKVTRMARFVNMINGWRSFSNLLDPRWIGCYITLTVTAPGNIIWIGTVQSNLPYAQEWYAKLIKIKKEYAALQSDNIEDALISPKIKGLIAYNRWDKDESATIIVNVNDRPIDCAVKTRFKGDRVKVYDLISGEELEGNPESFNLTIPAYGSRILVLSEAD